MGETAKIKWGIMASGWIAEQFAEDLAHAGNGEAYAVGSRSLEKAKRLRINTVSRRLTAAMRSFWRMPTWTRFMWRLRILCTRTMSCWRCGPEKRFCAKSRLR